ncbi:MAG TPA: hypothetical protein VGR89_08055, partial [Puia sp.]|nr:hypothetical protein [Puia sp.]
FLMSSTIKTVYKARSGSEAELNLLMTAMLIHAKLDAAAVVLSTRSNGFIDVDIPQPSQLNYVVSKLRLGGKAYYLDASDRDLGFGQLPLECYNGYDIAVDTTELYPENALSADSLTEKTKVVVFLTNGDKGGMDASVQSYPGPAEAVEIRKKMKGPDGEKKFIDGLRAGFPTDESISGLEIDSLGRPDDPMVVNYNCHLDMDSAADKLYITPTMVGRLAVNPFKETERHYPVEMPYARDENYILTLDIPGGYVVDELPQSTQILLGDGSYFEYVMSHDGDQIHFRTRLKLVRANFEPDAYAFLRNFFAAIVDKEGEQIVFRRKK